MSAVGLPAFAPQLSSAVRIPAIAIKAANDPEPAGVAHGRAVSDPDSRLAAERSRQPIAAEVHVDAEQAVALPALTGAPKTPRPLSTYRGVAVTVRLDAEDTFELSLKHDDDAHSVPLAQSCDASAIAWQWQAWAKALQMPLIAIEADGAVHAELTALGVLLAEQPLPRRKGSPLVGRRSRYGRRRRGAPLPYGIDSAPKVAGREVIART